MGCEGVYFNWMVSSGHESIMFTHVLYDKPKINTGVTFIQIH